MGKSKFFTGQPVLNQLLNLLDRNRIFSLARNGEHDRYYRYFNTYSHLVTMLYHSLNKCTSSREVVSGMKACHHKLSHLGLLRAPGKSTLCDANKKRSSEVFGQIYRLLYRRHRQLLPDSRPDNLSHKLFIADSSTITLFQEILKAPSMGRADGKRKGGIKVHTLMDAEEDVAVKISFTSARANDMGFLKELHLERGSFIVFDKGYVDYSEYQRMSDGGVFFVTRQRCGASYQLLATNHVSTQSEGMGVQNDQTIVLGTRTHKKKIQLTSRLITFYDRDKQRSFEFLTNNFDLEPHLIAELYKKRWQIEVLFKRVKQNFPLKYFLGDNENAIRIQIWCAFIADLLIKLVQVQLKRKWAFSNLSSIIRLHLMNYLHLFNFLNAPDKIPSNENAGQIAMEGLQISFRT